MAFKEIGVIESLYYDGPIAQVVAILDNHSKVRVEIRLVVGRHEQVNDFCGEYVAISPTFDVLQEWMRKAQELRDLHMQTSEGDAE